MCSLTNHDETSTSTYRRNPQEFFSSETRFFSAQDLLQNIETNVSLPGVLKLPPFRTEVPSRQVSNDRCGNHRVTRDVTEMCIEIDPSTGVLEQRGCKAHLSCTRMAELILVFGDFYPLVI